MKARSKARPTKGASPLPPAKPCGKKADSCITANDFWESLALAAAGADSAKALDRALAIIGSIYRADRAWMGRYNSALTHFWGVSDWVEPGIVSHLQEMQGVSTDMLGKAHQTFLRGEIVSVPDVERLPRQARGLQAELRREGIRSTFGVPLMHNGKLIGFFGLDHVRETAAWTSADLDRLPALAEFLAVLLHRSLTATPPADLPATPHRLIHVTESGSMRALSIDSIIFIEADGDYSRIHTCDEGRYLERRSLRSWIAQMPRERFLRVHHRYLVNGARIARLDRGSRWMLHLQEIPDPIPVGRTFRHALRLHMGF